jgi:hypothetical protein
VTARPHCPHCGSPDLARYKMPPGQLSDLYRAQYPGAMLCLDCDRVTLVVAPPKETA